MIEPADVLNRVVGGLSKYRFAFKNEAELQQGISAILTRLDVWHELEVRVHPYRLDILCRDGLAIEVKVSRNRVSLIRQLDRYAELALVREILVVSSVPFADMPTELRGKRITYHYIVESAF